MKAMILAAGRGERMRPLTDTTPKPLLKVGGKPLIVWHIENLVRAGITDLVINHAHLGHMIEAALGDGSPFGAKIRYSAEGEALETAGGIAHALPLLGNAPFLAVNGDIFIQYDFSRAQEMAMAMRANADMFAAYLVLADNPLHNERGDFALEHSMVKLTGQPMLTFTGVAVYQPDVFRDIERGAKAKLAPLLKTLIGYGLVRGEYHRARWVDVGTPQRLATLDRALK
ncbi:MAG: nucleotidyltransferase family protein [Burkholderiales bacterium]|nr:nucleotidyltransferase family protein [Burkholderiales bacterium]